MIPDRVVAATTSRFKERTAHRTEIEKKLKAGDRFSADTPDRVQKRLARLSMHAVVAAPAGAGEAVLQQAPLALERVLGTNDLMSVTFLERAVRAGRAVGRVRIRGANGQTRGFGTGSLISPRLLLTNNHVLGAEAEAAPSLLELNFQDNVDGAAPAPVSFTLRPFEFFVTDPDLDYTIVAVSETSGPQRLAEFGFNRLVEAEGKAIIGEYLNIIQHPNGEPKQIALRENQLLDVLDKFVHYHTDTAPGSSGSPVFNDQWEVVALHHSGVPKTDAAGNYLTTDGQIWTPSMGEHRIHWIANEGARISRIVKHLKARTLGASARPLRAQIFDAPEFVPTAAAAAPSQGVNVKDDGTISWTLPLPPMQISLKLGDLAGALGLPATAATAAATAQPAATAAAPAIVDDPELRDILAEHERAKKQPYYSESKDVEARDAYYSDIDVDAGGKAVFRALRELLDQSHQLELSYSPAKHVYPWVDLHPDLKIRSVYSGKTLDPEELIREDFRIDRERQELLQESLRTEASAGPARVTEIVDWLEAQLPYNCEHVVPQSWFSKREPMRGDLHHLFACEIGCNSFRGNKPYYDFPDFEEAIRDECGKSEQNNKFEPSAAKGIVARATLYFLLRYPRKVNSVMSTYDHSRLKMLLRWHRENPVSTYEKHRNAAVAEKQGNRNPLIDFPEWAEKIDFTEGL